MLTGALVVVAWCSIALVGAMGASAFLQGLKG